jgi:hypothetical protein
MGDIGITPLNGDFTRPINHWLHWQCPPLQPNVGHGTLPWSKGNPEETWDIHIIHPMGHDWSSIRMYLIYIYIYTYIYIYFNIFDFIVWLVCNALFLGRSALPCRSDCLGETSLDRPFIWVGEIPTSIRIRPLRFVIKIHRWRFPKMGGTPRQVIGPF